MLMYVLYCIKNPFLNNYIFTIHMFKWQLMVVLQFTVAIDFHSRKKIVWKSMAIVNSTVTNNLRVSKC